MRATNSDESLGPEPKLDPNAQGAQPITPGAKNHILILPPPKPVGMQKQQFSNWIKSPQINKCWVDAQSKRIIPIEIGMYDIVPFSPSTVALLVNKLNQLEPDPTKLRFTVQKLYENGSKGFESPNPQSWTGNEIERQPNLIHKIYENPNYMLSMQLNNPNFVVIDIDPSPDNPNEIPVVEEIMLNGLPDLLKLTDPYLTDHSSRHPIVIQTPRGLHMIFTIPKGMKPKLTKDRRKISRLGFTFEYIISGNCVLIGQDYRIITSITPLIEITPLPFPLWPLSGKLQNRVKLEGYIPIGQRYNTLINGIVTSQFAYLSKGPLIEWINNYIVEKDSEGKGLKESELAYLCHKAGARWDKMSENLKAGPAVGSLDFVIPEVQNGSDHSLTSYLDMLRRLAKSAQDKLITGTRYTGQEKVVLQNIMNSPAFVNVVQDLSFQAVGAISMAFWGLYTGSAAAISLYTSGRQKYLIYNREQEEYFFYDQRKGAWFVLKEDMVREIVRSLLESLGTPDLQKKESTDKVIEEIKERIGMSSLGHLTSGFAYNDGVLLIGWDPDSPLDPDPYFEVRNSIPFSYKESNKFYRETEVYLRNLVHYNKPNLHLLRTELFKAVFKVGTPTHFLYIQGAPGSGKSLLFNYLEFLLGDGSVYTQSQVGFDQPFAFAGVSSNLKFVVFADADSSANTGRLLSFVKERSTSNQLRVKKKFINKETILLNIHYAIVCNSFLRSPDLAESLERRQIIIQPLAVPLNDQKPNLLDTLKRNTAAMLKFISETPHVLNNLRTYSSALNYMTTSKILDFSSVVAFIFECIENESLFIVEGWSHPITSLSEEQGGPVYKETKGLFESYSNYMAGGAYAEKPATQREFQYIINELSRSVFFLEAETVSGTYCTNLRIPGSKKVDRICWHNIKFESNPIQQNILKQNNTPILTPKLPLEIAALALLHPATSDRSSFISQGEKSYNPGVTIHYKYPPDILEALVDAVKQGPDKEIQMAILQYRKQVASVVAAVQDRDFKYYKTLKELKMQMDPELERKIANLLENKNPKEDLYAENAIELDSAPTFSFHINPNNLDLSGYLESSELPVTKLNDSATGREVYNFLLGKIDSYSSKQAVPEYVDVEAKPKTTKYICKRAFVKLSKFYQDQASLNDKPWYSIYQDSDKNAVLKKNYERPEPVPQLIWDSKQCNIIDVILPEGIYSAPLIKTQEAHEPVIIANFERVNEEEPNLYEDKLEALNTIKIIQEQLLHFHHKLPSYKKNLSNNKEYKESLANTLEEIRMTLDSLLQNRSTLERIILINLEAYQLEKCTSTLNLTEKAILECNGVITKCSEALQALGSKKKEDISKNLYEIVNTNEAKDSSGTSTDVMIENFDMESSANVNTNLGTSTKGHVPNPELNPKSSVESKVMNAINIQKELRKVTPINEVLVQGPGRGGAYTWGQEFLDVAVINGCIIEEIKKEDLFESWDEVIPILGPLFKQQKYQHLYALMKQELLKLPLNDTMTLTMVKDYLLNQLVWEPLNQEKCPYQDELNSCNFPLTPSKCWINKDGYEAFFKLLKEYKWFETPFERSYMTRDPSAPVKNEQMREMYSHWTEVSRMPIVLNELLGKYMTLAGLVWGFVENILDLVEGNYSVSSITGIRRRSFFWNAKDFSQPFAVGYKGSAQMKDPGRLAVQGTTFTTYVKSFRDSVVPKMLTVFGAKYELTFFILDLKGCHAALQAALFPESKLFELYSKPNLDLWEEFVTASPDNQLTWGDKPLLKISFYAALNGGNVFSEPAILAKFGSIRPGNQLYDRIKSFPQAFLNNPITQELNNVRQFWVNLNGEVSVPTRSTKIKRKLTAKEAEKAYQKISLRNISGGKPPSEGDPIPRQLPTLFYTSMELILMSKIYAFVVEYCYAQNVPIAGVQGIHDGILFVSKGTLNKQDLLKFVLDKLREITQEAFSLSFSVTLTDCENSTWLAGFSENTFI